MSGPSPPPPPPPPPVEWHPSSGFQSDYDSVPPPPGVFSAPVTFGFPRSPAPALADQIPALWSPGIGAGLFRQVTPSQATFLNPNSSSHCWPTTPSIQSPGVMPGIYLQQTFVSQAPPKLAGYGSQSFCYGTPSTSVAHNANAVSQPTNFDKIDLKEIIPTLRGLIAQVNESVRKIVSMVKIKPDTLPLKTFDPQIVVSTRERMATHSIMEDCLDHRASSESLKRSDELTTASTIFNNILTSSRKSRDNPFYKDAPGVVQVPVYPNDGSFENLKLPDFAMGERWDELTLESFGADREVQGTLLPSRYWLVSKEIAEWTVLPKKLTLYQLKALAGLPLVQQADLKKWLLTHGRSYGVPCSSSLADHIVFLLVFCLRAVHREATPLIDSSEKLALVDCRTLHQTASWLSIQLAPAYDAACCANLVLGLYKYALKMAAYCSVRPLRRSGPEGVQKEESIKVGAGLEQEPHYHPFPSSEACTDLSEQSSCVGDGVLCLQHLAAAILAIHAQAVHKTCTASDLLTCLPNQRSAVHMMVTNKAAEVRATRAGYRAVLEHDGLMWQRPQNQDFRKNKSKEELLAEERDYKRRRMSYRGKKAQRTPAEVLRDIIEGHMEDIVAAGGIGCIGRRPHDVLLSESETLSSALGKNDNAISWQSGSRDVASKELHSSYHDCSRFSRSKSRDLFRMERGERHRSNSMFLSSSSQRHDQSSRERSESLSYAHSGDKSSDRKYESTRVRRKWESTRHGERQSSKYYSPAHE